MINNKIDLILSKEMNGVINIVDNGFQKDRYVNQLFNIYKNCENFSII